MKNLLIGAAILGAGIWAYREYTLYEGLSFNIAWAEFGGTWSSPQVKLKISLDNQSGVSARLDSIDANILSGSGQYIAKVAYNTQQVIAPFNTTFIDLVITPDVQSAIVALATGLLNKGMDFVFKGSAVVDGIGVPINMSYHFGQTT